MAKTKITTISEICDQIRSKYFPFKTSSGVLCVPASRQECYKFLRENFKAVFPDRFGNHYAGTPTPKRKLQYSYLYAEYEKIHHEFFLFKKGSKIVGWSHGEMEDYETFYMRNTGILPAYQNQGIYREFLPQFLNFLKNAGYQRVSSQHHPDNSRIITLKTQIGFIVTGSENYERWGHLLKLVKIFDPKREKFFKQKFC